MISEHLFLSHGAKHLLAKKEEHELRKSYPKPQANTGVRTHFENLGNLFI